MINIRPSSFVKLIQNVTRGQVKYHRNHKNEGRTWKPIKMAPNENTAASGGYQDIRPTDSGADVTVDLRSDTVTIPSKGMREAIANALVGDDVFDEDPTTKEFECRLAKLFGKEAALLVSSGTQGNLICGLVHCNARGSEMICGDKSHIFLYEQGNIAQLGGVHSAQIKNEQDGTFCLDELQLKFRISDQHYPITKVVCVENTHNRCGGRVLPLEWLDKLAEICKTHNVPIHMDGARIFNAAVASGVPVSRIARDMASISICLSKGLGAPIGSVIVGEKSFIEQARRMRKALGGGMRQNGIVAAAGIYCLDNMIDRLKEDHQNARKIAEIISNHGGECLTLDAEALQTNILILDVRGIPILEFCESIASVQNKEDEMKILGGKTVAVKCFPWSSTAVRLVLHCDVTAEMAELAARKICYVASQTRNT